MHAWRVASYPETGGFTHTIDSGHGHALLTPLIASVFQLLRVSASLCDGRLWWSIHSEPDLIQFEVGHSAEGPRWTYNGRIFAEVLAHGKAVRGEHTGLCDVFVPVFLGKDVAAIMVAGPFFTKRPTGADVLERWRWLSGRQGRPADPEFASYLRTTLGTLVLDGGKAPLFQRLLVCLARLMAADGRADQLANEADKLRLQIERARFAERMWEAARGMIDEQSPRIEHSAARYWEFGQFGMSIAPDHVVVGLAVRRGKELDPVEEAVRREGFQRSCVDLAFKVGDVISGKVGDHGVVFLVGARGSVQRKKKKVSDLADQIASLARRRFGLSIHFGASGPSGPDELGSGYQAALAAAELGLTQNRKLVFEPPSPDHRLSPFWSMRQDLARTAQERADRLPAQFDRYVESVTARSRHRIEPARTELQICFERMGDALLQSGALDPKGLLAIRDSLDRASRAGSTMSDLTASYRQATADLSATAARPAAARQERGLRGALDYIHRHYSEPLTLESVARVSGFARTYFSELFKEHQGMTFQRYLFNLRIERAKKLLTGTELNVTRIAELCGHGGAPYLCRVFRRVVGVTPLEYRRGVAPFRLKKGA